MCLVPVNLRYGIWNVTNMRACYRPRFLMKEILLYGLATPSVLLQDLLIRPGNGLNTSAKCSQTTEEAIVSWQVMSHKRPCGAGRT